MTDTALRFSNDKLFKDEKIWLFCVAPDLEVIYSNELHYAHGYRFCISLFVQS